MKEQKDHTKNQITDRGKYCHLCTFTVMSWKLKSIHQLIFVKDNNNICILRKKGNRKYIQICTIKTPQNKEKNQIKRLHQVLRNGTKMINNQINLDETIEIQGKKFSRHPDRKKKTSPTRKKSQADFTLTQNRIQCQETMKKYL